MDPSQVSSARPITRASTKRIGSFIEARRVLRLHVHSQAWICYSSDMRLEDLGLIGNCQYSVLIENTGEVVWCCLPRFDSEPVLSSLLDDQDGGRFTVGAPDGAPGVQRYFENTNVLETKFTTPHGVFRVIDFAPRFSQYERSFHPT